MISVIIPVYNAEKTLANCLDSVLSQDYKDIEIIAVNDGSLDNSHEILMHYKAIDCRIKVLSQQNSGVSCARNKALDVAQGEYIMFVDSDDTIQSNACSKALCSMKDDVDMVIFGLNIYRNGKLLRTPHLETRKFKLRNSIDAYWNLRKINLGPCNKLYKKSLIKKQFDTTLSLGEDTLFVLEYMKNVRDVSCLENCLYNVRLDNENSLNRKYRDNRLDQLIYVRNHELVAINDIYGNTSDSRIYEEYFLDLHVILTGLFYHNVDSKLNKIRENVAKFNYGSVYYKTNFSSIYYRIFSRFVSSHRIFLLYMLLRLRLIIEKIFLTR